MRFQLAFQGGGARFAVLLAAADAIEELVANSEITVTNIAGTSAGAIVGAFLAAGVPISKIRAQLTGEEGAGILHAYQRPPWYVALWKIYRGEPFWDDKTLKRWLESQFDTIRAESTAARVADLRLPLFVVASNVSSGEPRKSSPDDDLVATLLDSSGLPFCFRGWKSANNAVIVDGGLCENLPIDDLVPRTNSDGRILAFSFRRSSPGRPSGALAFCTALLDIAINRSVQIARDRLGGGSVYTLNTRIKTFDFVAARQFLGSPEYDATKAAVLKWIREIMAAERRANDRPIDYWRHQKDSRLQEVMAVTGRIYATQHEPHKLHFAAVRLVVTCNCLAEPGSAGYGQPDDVYYELIIRAKDYPVSAHRMTLSTPSGAELLGNFTVRVFDQSGAAVDFELLPSITPNSPNERALIVFFKRALEPGAGEYRVSIHDMGKDLMVGLSKPGGDGDGFYVSVGRAAGPIGTVQFGIHVPASFRRVRQKRTNLSNAKFVGDGAALNAFGRPPLGFRTAGIIADNVNNSSDLEYFFES